MIAINHRTLYVLFGAVLALLASMGVVSYRTVVRSAGSEQRLVHTYEVQAKFEGLLSEVAEAESEARSYQLSGDERRLESFSAAMDPVPETLKALQTLIADNPKQQRRLTAIEPVIGQRFSLLKELVHLGKKGERDPALQTALLEKGSGEMVIIRTLVSEMEAEENRLLEARKAESQVVYRYTVATLLAGNLVGVVLLICVFSLLNRDIRERLLAEAHVLAINAELEQRVTERTAEIATIRMELEKRVKHRTAELEATNKELETFTYSVSHDLRAPVRHIHGFSKILLEDFGPRLEPAAQNFLQQIQEATQHMGHLVDDLLNLARLGRQEITVQITGLNALVQEVVEDLKSETHDRQIEWQIGKLPFVECDPGLMKQVFANLLSNALKYTRPRDHAVIEVGQATVDGREEIFVRDNGVGFNMKYADKLFGVFQRLHRQEDFEGTGVGLATVLRIIHKHGGQIRAEAELDKGAAFYFTLGARGSVSQIEESNGDMACQEAK